MLSERNPLSITFPEFETYITAQQFNLSFFDVYLRFKTTILSRFLYKLEYSYQLE